MEGPVAFWEVQEAINIDRLDVEVDGVQWEAWR